MGLRISQLQRLEGVSDTPPLARFHKLSPPFPLHIYSFTYIRWFEKTEKRGGLHLKFRILLVRRKLDLKGKSSSHTYAPSFVFIVNSSTCKCTPSVSGMDPLYFGSMKSFTKKNQIGTNTKS